MEATDALVILRQAHKEGSAKLDLLELAVDDLREGDTLSARDKLQSVFQFFDADLPVHFRQEEQVLFPALEQSLAPPGPILLRGEEVDFCQFLPCLASCCSLGPLAVYRQEHEVLWQYVSSLRSAVGQLESTKRKPGRRLAPKVELVAGQLIWWLRAHIAKENKVLLPKAEEVLSRSALAEMLVAMEQIRP